MQRIPHCCWSSMLRPKMVMLAEDGDAVIGGGHSNQAESDAAEQLEYTEAIEAQPAA
jgi:hypothetical protein